MLSSAGETKGGPAIWVLCDHKIGSKNQCLALADAIAQRWRATIDTKELRLKKPWRWLAPQFHPLSLGLLEAQSCSALSAPWPDLVIASGSKLVAPALAIKAASQGRCKAIQILDPSCHRARFDAIITPEHDQLRGSNVISIKGALALHDQQRLDEGRAVVAPLMLGPGPHVAVMIGGSNKDYELTSAALIAPVERLLETGAGRVYLCSSRRTPAAVLHELEQRFADDERVWLRDQAGANPYWGLLVQSDLVCVTQDSISMVSEAASLGRPVLTLPLLRRRQRPWPFARRAKFPAFEAAMLAGGHVRRFTAGFEVWDAPKLDDMATALAGLEPLLEQHFGCDNSRS